MHAADIMTRNVITVPLSATLQEIAQTLIDHQISAVPVVDAGGHIVGMISEGDLVHRHETATERRRSWWLQLFVDNDTMARDYVKSHSLKAEDIMARRVVSVRESTPLSTVADLLDSENVKRVPVVQDGKPVGIVSRADLVRALLKATRQEHAPARSDAEIQAELNKRLEQEPWADSIGLAITVHAGVVELFGFVRTEAQLKGLTVLAETVPGVSRVDNRLRLRPFVES